MNGLVLVGAAEATCPWGEICDDPIWYGHFILDVVFQLVAVCSTYDVREASEKELKLDLHTLEDENKATVNIWSV